MEQKIVAPSENVVGFIDIGTNSIRLMLVQLTSNSSYTVLREEKEVVRLGESIFKKGFFQPETMTRALLVCKKFVEVSRGFGAREIIAVATAAAREAKNQKEFLERLREETTLDVRVVSGGEEARLIYLGVSSGVHVDKKIAVFVDIGGGSTEIIIGDQFQHYDIESMGLGAIRLTTLFLSGRGNGVVSPETYEKMKRYVKNKLVHVTERVNPKKLDVAFGSSGTIINLAEIASKMFERTETKQDMVLRYKDLQKVIAKLCSLSVAERRLIPGINPERADIIIGGAVIIETIMEDLELKELFVSYRDMRYGMLVDYLSRHAGYPQHNETSVRKSSVLRLGHSCNVNEHHANRVVSLSLQLFDGSKAIKLHDLGDDERELLEYAAFLHDIGDFISFRGHHLHSYYIINNAELLGFDQTEIGIIANVARFHRKKLPRKKEPSLIELDKHSIKTVVILSTLLRIAEKLDRSHTDLVQKIEFVLHGENKVELLLVCSKQDCEFERWGVEEDSDAFEKVFEKRLFVSVIKNEPQILA
ncbi:MAG: Ppx/GppA phosphatase family protein [Euryarchaeota archaeon]|nr:Ppx/GppA phosphatase family protein [Euryarchaeota archaeon]